MSITMDPNDVARSLSKLTLGREDDQGQLEAEQGRAKGKEDDKQPTSDTPKTAAVGDTAHARLNEKQITRLIQRQLYIPPYRRSENVTSVDKHAQPGIPSGQKPSTQPRGEVRPVSHALSVHPLSTPRHSPLLEKSRVNSEQLAHPSKHTQQKSNSERVRSAAQSNPTKLRTVPQGPVRLPRGQDPLIKLLPRPEPSTQYLLQASQQPSRRSNSQPLLVILDLNGTLLHRNRNNKRITERPHVEEFLSYLLKKHKVMIWSSARPHSVIDMLEKLPFPALRKQLVAVWNRKDLRLTPVEYSARTQIYKQLSWVWENAAIKALSPDPSLPWSQANTVLIDDSREKAASEPYNLIEIEEFVVPRGHDITQEVKDDTLIRLMAYLDELCTQNDVSAYIHAQPFPRNERRVDGAPQAA